MLRDSVGRSVDRSVRRISVCFLCFFLRFLNIRNIARLIKVTIMKYIWEYIQSFEIHLNKFMEEQICVHRISSEMIIEMVFIWSSIIPINQEHISDVKDVALQTTDGTQTDWRMDRGADKASYRDARTHLSKTTHKWIIHSYFVP